MKRVALVTGGVTGIGAAICRGLKAAGYEVVTTHFRNGTEAERFWKETSIPIFEWNVTDYESCEQGIKEVEAKYGPVDILINNAGIAQDSMLHKMTPAQWRAVIDVDLTGVFNMCRAVINGMRERRFGRIINISSINGQSGQAGQTNYSAAKAGVIGFSKALAQEGASRGITVNVIAPGYTDTAMMSAIPENVLQGILGTVPVGRLGSPDEIARGVLFLVEDTGFVTGATLAINGGKYMA